jgi:hypothetical protein
MREFAAEGWPAQALARMAAPAYRRLWRSAFAASRPPIPAGEAVAQLARVARQRDDVTLLAELAAWRDARAGLATQPIAGLSKVPSLNVTAHLEEADLDRALRFFVDFALWPQPKAAAWARFTNADPPLDPRDIVSATIFYRADRRTLLFAVQRHSGRYEPEYDATGVRGEDLGCLTGVADLAAL